MLNIGGPGNGPPSGLQSRAKRKTRCAVGRLDWVDRMNQVVLCSRGLYRKEVPHDRCAGRPSRCAPSPALTHAVAAGVKAAASIGVPEAVRGHDMSTGKATPPPTGA